MIFLHEGGRIIRFPFDSPSIQQHNPAAHPVNESHVMADEQHRLSSPCLTDYFVDALLPESGFSSFREPRKPVSPTLSRRARGIGFLSRYEPKPAVVKIFAKDL
jgi:hypothetical protein